MDGASWTVPLGQKDYVITLRAVVPEEIAKIQNGNYRGAHAAITGSLTTNV